MRIVTVWESKMLCWSNVKDDGTLGETTVRGHRSFMFYLDRKRAAEASPGGEPIERRILEKDGIYYMRRDPYYGEITDIEDVPTDRKDLRAVGVFRSDRWDDLSPMHEDS